MKKINKNGFTLLEVLLVMGIAVIVMGAIYSAYDSQQRVHNTQQQIVEMQQNARAAMMMMTRDLRMAAYGAERYGWYNETLSSNVFLNGIIGKNDFTVDPPVYDPALTDRISVVGPAGEGDATITTAMPTPSSVLQVDSVEGFEKGDIVIITDGKNANLMQITDTNDVSLILLHNSGTLNCDCPYDGEKTINSPTNEEFPPGGYGEGSKVLKMQYRSYFIDKDDDGRPRLMLDDGFAPLGVYNSSPLVQNIEDMQIVYTFADGDKADDFDPDGSETPSDATDDYQAIRSIRLTILARTHNEMLEPVYINETGIHPEIEDHEIDPPPTKDHYRRFQLTTEIKVRNLGL